MNKQLKAALRDRLVDTQLDHYLKGKGENIGQYRTRHECSCGEDVYVDGHNPLESNLHAQQAKHITDAILAALQPEIERLVVEAEENVILKLIGKLPAFPGHIPSLDERKVNELLGKLLMAKYEELLKSKTATQSNQKEVNQ